jgi:phosphinothricin acetyltransferase
MHIRDAVEADLPALVAIYNEAVAEARTADTEPQTVAGRRAWFERHDRLPLLVAEIGGGDGNDGNGNAEIAGYASLSEYRPGRAALRGVVEISYYVAAAHRRKGVATNLIQAGIDHCPALGVHSLFGILLEDNAPSIALLERFGFERWAHLPRVAIFPDADGDRGVGHVYYGRRVD